MAQPTTSDTLKKCAIVWLGIELSFNTKLGRANLLQNQKQTNNQKHNQLGCAFLFGQNCFKQGIKKDGFFNPSFLLLLLLEILVKKRSWLIYCEFYIHQRYKWHKGPQEN